MRPSTLATRPDLPARAGQAHVTGIGPARLRPDLLVEVEAVAAVA